MGRAALPPSFVLCVPRRAARLPSTRWVCAMRDRGERDDRDADGMGCVCACVCVLMGALLSCVCSASGADGVRGGMPCRVRFSLLSFLYTGRSHESRVSRDVSAVCLCGLRCAEARAASAVRTVRTQREKSDQTETLTRESRHSRQSPSGVRFFRGVSRSSVDHLGASVIGHRSVYGHRTSTSRFV